MAVELTEEQAEQMRTILLQYDGQKKREPNIFDLNHPPAKPYTHQEFPKMVFGAGYDHEIHGHPESKPEQREGMTKIVGSKAELEAALAEGWLLEPPKKNEPAKNKFAPRKAKASE